MTNSELTNEIMRIVFSNEYKNQGEERMAIKVLLDKERLQKQEQFLNQQEAAYHKNHVEYERQVKARGYCTECGQNWRGQEERRETEKYIRSLLTEIARLDREVKASVRLCSIYFNMLVPYLGEEKLRELRDRAIEIEMGCKCGYWEVIQGHNPLCPLAEKKQ